MTWHGLLITALIFLFTLLLPAISFVLIGYIYQQNGVVKKARAGDEQTAGNGKGASYADLAHLWEGTIPCWQVKECSVEDCSNCPAFQRPAVPCWLTMQLVTGTLLDDCMTCKVFHEANKHYPNHVNVTGE